MAKAILSASSDFDGLTKDLMDLAGSFSWEVKAAADKQLDFLANGIRMNWETMSPWKGTDTHNFVRDSIGYNVAYGGTGDVVGMAGVFQVDSVASKYGRTKHDISAPQFAYWVNYGFSPNPNSQLTYAALPFMDSAFYATLNQQDEIFANELATNISKRLKK